MHTLIHKLILVVNEEEGGWGGGGGGEMQSHIIMVNFYIPSCVQAPSKLTRFG